MNYLDSIQRREAIDEDKKIHKRALDSEFAFLKRIGEDTLPPKPLDKTLLLRIKTLIGFIRNELEGTITDFEDEIQKLVKEERTEEENILTTYTDSGKVVYTWNQLINLIKSLSTTPKDIDDFWDLIDSEISQPLYDVLDLIDSTRARLQDDELLNVYDTQALEKMAEYIYNKQLSTIPTSKYRSDPSFFKRPIGQAFETPEQALLNRQAIEQAQAREQGHQARQAIEGFRPELAHGLERRARTMERMRQAEREQGLPEGFIEPLGLGLGKPKRKSKKKMDTDEFEINIECHNKNMTTKQLKEMKKALKKMPLPFDDGDDSNYLK